MPWPLMVMMPSTAVSLNAGAQARFVALALPEQLAIARKLAFTVMAVNTMATVMVAMATARGRAGAVHCLRWLPWCSSTSGSAKRRAELPL